MSHRLIGAVALLVVLSAGAVLLPGWLDDDGAPGAANPTQATAAPTPLPTAGPSADPVRGTRAQKAPPSASSSASSSAGRVDTEVIVEPPGATSTAPSETGPGSLPKLPRRPSTLRLDRLPKQLVSVEGLVRGWPRRALPIIAGSRVGSTSVSPGPGVIQLGLDAVVAADPSAVLRRYRTALGTFGFVEQPSTDPNAGLGAGFTNGTDSVVVTVAPVESGTSYVVFAVLHPPGG